MLFICVFIVQPQIECGELIEKLIETYKTTEIQSLLERLSHGWPNHSLWTLYKKVTICSTQIIIKSGRIFRIS